MSAVRALLAWLSHAGCQELIGPADRRRLDRFLARLEESGILLDRLADEDEIDKGGPG
jgi:hypothetical protein